MGEGADFAVGCERSGEVLRVSVCGELDLLTEPELVSKVADALGQAGTGRLVLDLKKVGFIDSSGLRGLLRCQEDAGRYGLAMALAVDEGPVTRLLELAGVTGWFTYE